MYPNISNGEKLYSIDLLKSLAILMILFVHTGQMFKGSILYDTAKLGQLGCQCFFVISGFTLCLSWDRRKVTARDFFLRRYKTIAPGYYFTLLLFASITIFVQQFNIPHYWEANLELGGVLSNSFLIHGLFPDYMNTVVPGGWYIGTTILMYITFPLLKRTLEWMQGRSLWLTAVIPLLLSLTVISTWAFIEKYVPDIELGNDTFVYFSILTQYPCFVLGGVLYVLRCDVSKAPNLILTILLTVLFGASSIWLFFSEWQYAFAILPLLAASCSACVLVVLIRTVDSSTTYQGSFLQRNASRISRVSYEMYLLHTLFAYFLVWYAHKVVRYLTGIEIFYYTATMIVSYIVVIVCSYYSAKVMHRLINKVKEKLLKVTI